MQIGLVFKCLTPVMLSTRSGMKIGRCWLRALWIAALSFAWYREAAEPLHQSSTNLMGAVALDGRAPGAF